MCQSRAQGGRRCAAHHPGTLAMKFIARKEYGMEQAQADYAFKALRAEGNRRHTPTPERYQRFLNEMKDGIENSTEISATNKRQMLTKIGRALEIEQMPDGRTFYAMQNMERRLATMRAEVDNRITSQARLSGRSEASVRRDFRERYQSLVSPSNITDFSSDLDPRSEQAFQNMRDSVNLRFEETPRINRIPCNSVTIRSHGYDPEDGRLEVEMNNGRVHAFRGVPPTMYARMRAHPVATFNEVRTSHEYDYADTAEAERDANRVWCEHCSRFRLASGHACRENSGRLTHQVIEPNRVDAIFDRMRGTTTDSTPGTVPTRPAWLNATRTVATISDDDYVLSEGSQGRNPSNAKRIAPDMGKVMEALNAGQDVQFKVGRRIYVRGTGRREYNDVTQTVRASVVNGNYTVALAHQSEVACTCEVYQRNRRCTHTHPSNSSRVNRFVEQDINAALRDMQGARGNFNFVNSPGRGTALVMSGEQRNGMTMPSETDMNDITYQLVNSGHSVDMRMGQGERAPMLRASLDADGNVQVMNASGTAGSVVNRISRDLNASVSATEAMRLRRIAASQQAMGESWETSAATRADYMARFVHHGNGYLEHPDEFLADYRAASRFTADTLPFHRGAVTGGYLSEGPGRGARGFGIEVEFDGGAAARDRVAARLRQEGLSNTGSVAYYHQPNDFQNWRVEQDSSVSGELVSPILYDNEESWSQVERVCQIVRECGGTATVRTGNHIHIGAQGMSVDQRRGVFAAVVANQDVIRRVATNPRARNGHRTNGSNSYSAPFDDNDVSNVYQQHNNYYSRDYMMNQQRYRMANFTNERTIEFRDPDGSLNAAHIQANVMMAAALMQAGENGRWNDLTAATTRTQRVGANSLRQSYLGRVVQNEDERILAENISLMTTLDALFPDREARQRVLNVAAQNHWQPESHSRW